MNTFAIPYFELASSASSRGSMDQYTGGNVHVQRFLRTKDVYLCKTCAEFYGPQYIEFLTKMEKWAQDAGLL